MSCRKKQKKQLCCRELTSGWSNYSVYSTQIYLTMQCTPNVLKRVLHKIKLLEYKLSETWRVTCLPCGFLGYRGQMWTGEKLCTPVRRSSSNQPPHGQWCDHPIYSKLVLLAATQSTENHHALWLHLLFNCVQSSSTLLSLGDAGVSMGRMEIN
jgi:hypothetical protein